MKGDDFLAFLGIVRALARVHSDVAVARLLPKGWAALPNLLPLLTHRDRAALLRFDATHAARARDLGRACAPYVRHVTDDVLRAFAARVWAPGTDA